jgi:hypothetical protein
LVLERAGLRLDPTDDAGSDAEAGERTAIAAVDVEGRTVGRVSYRRVYGLRAEVTLAVDDEYWERGLPELLLVSLCARAESMQISTFLARVPASDVRLLALLREQFAARELRDGAYVQVEFATKRRCA